MNDAEHYRAMAETIRKKAEKFPDALSREQMLAIADQYEDLAQEVDRFKIGRWK
jgi:hypothetical protein